MSTPSLDTAAAAAGAATSGRSTQGVSPFGPLQDPRLIANPYPVYAALRNSHPVMRSPMPAEGAGVWFLTRHADVQQVLRDPRFSVERRRAQVIRDNTNALPAGLLQESGGLRSMLIMDAPDHTRIRKLVSKAFTPKRVAELADRVQQITGELFDDIAARGDETFDIIDDLGAPLPAIVIAELLGVPSADHRQFKEWSSSLVKLLGHPRPAEIMEEFQENFDQLLGYLGAIIDERRREPQEDLISAMIHAQEADDALSDSELLATCNLILTAGHETTTNLIGNGSLALLRHPEQLERLRAEPELLARAVEELLRFDSPVQATVRVTLEDVQIGDQLIPKDALVITSVAAANRDAEVFTRPNRLDIGRNPNPHISFGFGAHFCLGAPLARLEGEVFFRNLVARCPELELAVDPAEIRWRPNPILRGLESLPVREPGGFATA